MDDEEQFSFGHQKKAYPNQVAWLQVPLRFEFIKKT
jgi:hypothetical protein